MKYILELETGDDGYCETCSSPYGYISISKWDGSKFVGQANIRYSSDLPEPDENGVLTLNLPELYDRFNVKHRQF